jgi:hypothetical protein
MSDDGPAILAFFLLFYLGVIVWIGTDLGNFCGRLARAIPPK